MKLEKLFTGIKKIKFININFLMNNKLLRIFTRTFRIGTIYSPQYLFL